MKKHTLFIILIIGIALAIGIWRENQSSKGQDKQFASVAALSVGTALVLPQKLPEFELSNMEGKPFTNDAFKKHWSFVFFGYTNCPQICPTTLSAMNQISLRLRNPDVQYIFISIDPLNDTPERLKNYLQQAKFNGSSIVGLTGQSVQVQRLAKTIGIYISQETDISSEHIEHSGSLLLINPEGKLAAVFTSTDKPHAIAHDFKKILHRYTNVA